MTKVTELAKRLYDTFETRKRDNDTEFVSSEDETAKRIVQSVHFAFPGEPLPNDWIYEATRDALGAISDVSPDVTFEDYTHEYCDGAVDTYYTDLYKWVSEPFAADLINEAVNELGYPGEFSKAVAYGQYRAHEIIYSTVLSELQELVTEEPVA